MPATIPREVELNGRNEAYTVKVLQHSGIKDTRKRKLKFKIFNTLTWTGKRTQQNQCLVAQAAFAGSVQATNPRGVSHNWPHFSEEMIVLHPHDVYQNERLHESVHLWCELVDVSMVDKMK